MNEGPHNIIDSEDRPEQRIRTKAEDNLHSGVKPEGLSPEQHVFSEGKGGGILSRSLLKRNLPNAVNMRPDLPSATFRRGPVHTHPRTRLKDFAKGDVEGKWGEEEMMDADFKPGDYSKISEFRRMSRNFRRTRKNQRT